MNLSPSSFFPSLVRLGLTLALLAGAFSIQAADQSPAKPPAWPQITNIVSANLPAAKDVKPPVPANELVPFMDRLLRGQPSGRKDAITQIYPKVQLDGHGHMSGTVVCYFTEQNVFYVYADCSMNHMDRVAGPFQGDPRKVLKQFEKQP